MGKNCNGGWIIKVEDSKFIQVLNHLLHNGKISSICVMSVSPASCYPIILLMVAIHTMECILIMEKFDDEKFIDSKVTTKTCRTS